MRMVRTVAATFAGMLLVPAVAFAQANASAAPARDAWYWGVNGGALMFNAGYDSEQSVTAPAFGAVIASFAMRVSISRRSSTSSRGL
jgi:hypothetical protein